MEMNEIFSERLKRARIMRGLSMDSLCERLEDKVSKQTISKYENGKMLPGSTNLISLSNALEVPIDYFFRQDNYSVGNIEFRKKAKLGKKKIDSIKERIRDSVERYMEIEGICNINSFFENPVEDIPISSKEDVKQAADVLRKQWQLGEDGIVNVMDLLEMNNIKVISLDLPENKDFDGLSGYINENKGLPFVVVNKAVSTERRRFTALHELGHMVLKFVEGLEHDVIEHLCNFFANEILISAERFRELIGNKRTSISLTELRAIQGEYGISIEALMYKARELGVISEYRYKGFCNRKASDAGLKGWVERSIFPEKKEGVSRFESLAYKALASDIISSSKAASLLNMSVEEVNCRAYVV